MRETVENCGLFALTTNSLPSARRLGMVDGGLGARRDRDGNVPNYALRRSRSVSSRRLTRRLASFTISNR
jgi:hypothetical protein